MPCHAVEGREEVCHRSHPSQTHLPFNNMTTTEKKVLKIFERNVGPWGRSTDDSLVPSNEMEKTSPTKGVTFCEEVKVYFTISLQDISPREHKAIWYSKSEYKEITRSSCRQIKNLERGKLFKDKKYCSRGLETHTRTASLTKRINHKLSHNVVFDEQARQHREGVHEVEYLAYLYHSVSSSCQLWANAVGLSDQRAAEEQNHPHRGDYYGIVHSAQIIPQPRLVAVHSTTTSPGRKISVIHPATTRLRIRNIELARAA